MSKCNTGNAPDLSVASDRPQALGSLEHLIQEKGERHHQNFQNSVVP